MIKTDSAVKKSVFDIPPVLLKDGYKVGHVFQYPDDTTMVYSNFTARKGRGDATGIIFFGLQYFIMEYLINQFERNFFDVDKKTVLREYKRRMDNYLGPDSITVDHIGKLHDLGYLPIVIKSLPEGDFVPYGVPVLTIRNTHDDFFWLTNMLETLMSNVLWMGSTSATTAYDFRRNFEEAAQVTVGNDLSFVPWQGHDFSMRGMSGIESAMISGAAHLTSFTGTDTIPAIDFLETYYGANSDNELIGGSVPATEHSVMCMGGDSTELNTFERLLFDVYPDAPVLSVVSDTWDLGQVVTEFLPKLKDRIMQRPGKLVIRPDSGDPVKIVCGDRDARRGSWENKGVIECLWETFGGTITDRGYKLLDSHIGLIYGDGISLDRQEQMLKGLARKGFASYNIVLGIGSYTYQHVTRDTHGFAMKATAGKTKSKGLMEIYKDPKTDDGSKKSAKGLLEVFRNFSGQYELADQVSEQEENEGELVERFVDGKMINTQTLSEIRQRVTNNL